MQYCIGWDVGGWNCDRNRNSRDALAIVDDGGNPVGQTWRGNLRTHINQTPDAKAWVSTLFALCRAAPSDAAVTLAIDAPLGFPQAFIRLVTCHQPAAEIGGHAENPYLYRLTEHFLFAHGLRPLSPVKDMIGSQATKAIHVLAKFAPKVVGCGVWSDGDRLTVIEAYPSACKNSHRIRQLLQHLPVPATSDERDAQVCALTAFLFTRERSALIPPTGDVTNKEGWIWLPKDALR